MRKRTIIISLAVGVLALGLGTALASIAGVPPFAPASQAAPNTAFTYSGSLTHSGAPARGTYDMRFMLHDSRTGTSLKAPAETLVTGVEVVDGQFAVDLDFGAGVATGSRWLGIEVRPAGTSTFTALSPRQQLATVPLAVHATTADNATSLGGRSTSDFLLRSGGTVSGNLTVQGQLRIASGSPGAGKVLVSDANGNASWQAIQVTSGETSPAGTLIAPDATRNWGYLEIEGVMQGRVVVVSGPGWAIERLSGVDQFGRPDDRPGVSTELPFVFEYVDDPTLGETWESNLQGYYDEYSAAAPVDRVRRAASLIFGSILTPDHPSGGEVFRINMFELGPKAVEPGLDGRTRYTYQQDRFGPDNIMGVERDGNIGDNMRLRNPATDDQAIEISGINTGMFPEIVEINEQNRTVTLVFDWSEGQAIFDWANEIAEVGPFNAYKRDMSIISVNQSQPLNSFGGPNEVSRRNYYGVFPIEYQIVDGFSTAFQSKQRLVLSFDVSEDA